MNQDAFLVEKVGGDTERWILIPLAEPFDFHVDRVKVVLKERKRASCLRVGLTEKKAEEEEWFIIPKKDDCFLLKSVRNGRLLKGGNELSLGKEEEEECLWKITQNKSSFFITNKKENKSLKVVEGKVWLIDGGVSCGSEWTLLPSSSFFPTEEWSPLNHLHLDPIYDKVIKTFLLCVKRTLKERVPKYLFFDILKKVNFNLF